MSHQTWALLAGIVLGTSLAGCSLVVHDYAVDASPGGVQDSEPLCEVERKAFVLPLDLESRDARADLTEYYSAANSELVSHFEAVASDYRDGVVSQGVTYVTGSAGVGKSFILRQITDVFDPSDQCEIDVRDALTSVGSGFDVEMRPDLATTNGEIVFNELPALVGNQTFDLEDLLDAQGCVVGGRLLPLVVIDGIDEVHATLSYALLEAVDECILRGELCSVGFVRFVVAGRPEGFVGWLTNPERTEKNQKILTEFALQAPQYVTAGDLEFRVRGYLEFAGELDDLEASGELDEYVASFQDAVSQHAFLSYSIGNLAVGNVVVQHTAPGLDETEEDLKAGLFDDILLRNVQTHGRPGAGSEYDSAYRRVLEAVAVRTAPDVTDAGVFTVRAEDTVPVVDDNGEELGKVRIRDVLDRAGVSFLTSASTSTTRYRFDPFWLHAHLVERHNQRLGAPYGTCE